MDHSTAPSYVGPDRPTTPPRDVSRHGAALVLIAAVLWGTTGATQVLAPPEASALTIATARLCAGGLILLAWALVHSGPGRMAACWTRSTWAFTVVGIGSVTAYQALFFSAVRSTGVATGTLVAIGCAPLITGLLGLAIKERLSRTWAMATAITIAGLALLIIPGGAVQVRLSGMVYALAAAAAYSTYTVAGRMLLSRNVNGQVVVGTFFGFACLPIVVVTAGGDFSWLAAWNGIGVALWLGLGATAVPYLLWIRGLKTTTVSSATAIGLAEPLMASALGIFVLGEEATLWTLAGMAAIVAGLALVGRDGAATRNRRRVSKWRRRQWHRQELRSGSPAPGRQGLPDGARPEPAPATRTDPSPAHRD
ncbi:EamA family transporter [Micromonospora sp. KC606]|uniref:DMT family transporter n=1 Tax=Micromonospora sp. KC606 TaxID=2530379 RepID=UPI00244184BE|nr:EamA family transporter [Micromonospora sp. KC606]